MKKALFIAAWLLSNTLLYSQTNGVSTIYFKSDSYHLNPEQKNSLNALFSTNAHTIKRVELSGHTDNEGDSIYNLALSKNRCVAILNEISKTLNPDVVTFDYYGYGKPLNANKNANEKQMNRRVELKIYYSFNTKSEAKNLISLDNQQDSASVVNPYWNIYKELGPITQSFDVNPNVDNMITSRFGHKIFLPANSYDIPDDGLSKVTVEFTEANTISEMLCMNLNTSSDANPLESYGMWKLTAKYNGRTIGMRKNYEYLIVMNNNSITADAQMFTGSTNAINQQLNWSLITGSRLNWFEPKEYCGLFFCRILRFFGIENKKSKTSRLENDQLYKNYVKKYGKENIANVNKILDTNMELVNNVYSIPSFGLVNCDRFLDMPKNQLAKIKIDFVPDISVDAKMIFTSSKSIMPAYVNNGVYEFVNIPVNEKVKVIFLKNNGSENYQISNQDITIKKGLKIKPEFTNCTKGELKNTLSALR